jgi:hypothetical protein
MTEPHRLYRFAPNDHAGWFLGVSGLQCIVMAVGVLVGAALLNGGRPLLLAGLPVVIAATYSFAWIGGRPVHERAPVDALWIGRRVARRTSWCARVPLMSTEAAEKQQPELPPCLADLTILDVPSPGWISSRVGGVAVVHNTERGLLTATVRVHGREFALLDRGEQERVVAGWGEALAGFCHERGAIAFVRWTEWSAPSGLEEQRRYVDEHRAVPEDSPALNAYLELLADAGTMATAHEVLLSVTLDIRRVRRSSHEPPEQAATDSLLEELRLFVNRMDSAGLTVEPPLSPAELATVMRLRFDPDARHTIAARRRTLGSVAGLVSPYNAGPMATNEKRSSFHVDAALHRSFEIRQWPRLDVPPNWMEPILLYAGGSRAVTMTLHPIALSRSTRQVNRDSTKLESDAELRERKGFRITAEQRKAQAAVAEREAELVAGYPEFEYHGIVTVTGHDAESLERSCSEYEQAAAQSGLELRALDGQHDLAFAASLPVGVEVPTRRLA